MSDARDPVAAPSSSSDAAIQRVAEKSSVPTGDPKAEFSSDKQISSMASLREEAPEVYRAMTEGLARTVTRDMREHQQKIKELNRKNRDSAQGIA